MIYLGVGSPLTAHLSGRQYTAQELGQYAYYPGSQHTDKVVGQYAYCPGSKHADRVSKRAVTYILSTFRQKKMNTWNQNQHMVIDGTGVMTPVAWPLPWSQ